MAASSSLEETLKYSVAAADKSALAALDGKTRAFHGVTAHLATIPGQADAARALSEQFDAYFHDARASASIMLGVSQGDLGAALPPKQAASDDEVKKLVAANKSAIGYVKASSLDDSVKAVIK